MCALVMCATWASTWESEHQPPILSQAVSVSRGQARESRLKAIFSTVGGRERVGSLSRGLVQRRLQMLLASTLSRGKRRSGEAERRSGQGAVKPIRARELVPKTPHPNPRLCQEAHVVRVGVMCA